MVSVIDHDDEYLRRVETKSHGTLKGEKGSEGKFEEGEKNKELHRSKRPRLTEDQLVQKNGLPWLVNHMGSRCAPCKKVCADRLGQLLWEGVMHDKGKEGVWIKQLLNEYRKWGLQLYPRLAFEDLVVTVGKLSSKGRLRTFIAELREEERMRYLAEEYGDDIANKMKNHAVLSLGSAALAPARKGRYDELLQEDDEEEIAELQTRGNISQEEAAEQCLFPNEQSAAEVQLPREIIDYEDELLSDVDSKGTAEGA